MPNRRLHARRRGRSTGFSLIEVLIAVLVFALGMLGVAAMQAVSLRNTQSSYENSQAVLNIYSIVDAMRANREEAQIDRYNLPQWTCEAPAVVEDPATTADLAQNDLNEWVLTLKRDMGDTACGAIDCEGNACWIRVQWDDSRATDGDDDREVEMRVEL